MNKFLGKGPLYIIALFIVCIAIALCTSLYIYHGHDHQHTENYEGKVYAKEDVVIDAFKSFNRDGREKVVCYRESHRNFYIFALELTLIIVALTTYTAITRVRLSKKLYQQNQAIELQSQELERKTNEILSSIRYAKRLQLSLLPSTQKLNNTLSRTSLYYEPRDVISGDFYYIGDVKGFTIVCVGDCTGHGVPGAFLAVIAAQSLENIIIGQQINDPSHVLDLLNKTFYQILSAGSHEGTGDGLEISVVAINPQSRQTLIAAAGQSVLLSNIDATSEIRGERYTIGTEPDHKFLTHELQLPSQATIFQYSDGYADQFGGPAGRKFSRKALRQLLEQIAANPDQDGTTTLRNTYQTWRGAEPQIDDVLVLGYQIA